VTAAEARAILNSASAGDPDMPAAAITDALRVTGDLPDYEQTVVIRPAGSWECGACGVPATWIGGLA
jgi:hypothetical protein